MSEETSKVAETGEPAGAGNLAEAGEVAGTNSVAKKSSSRRRNVGKWLRRALWIVLALGIVALIVVAALPKPVPVDFVQVRRARLEVTVDEDGRTRVKDRYVIGAPLAGTLDRIELHPGDPVAEGQVIARIVPLARPLMDATTRAEAQARASAAAAARQQARAAIDRARAAVELAERTAARQRPLAQQGTVSPAQIDQIELELRARRQELASTEFGARVAAHQLEMANAALGRFDARDATAQGEQMEVSAPVGGVVLRILQQSAGVVAPGTPLVEIGDPQHLEIAVDVLTSDAVNIQNGAPVVIERWGGERPLRGRVRMVEPSAFTRISALGVEEQRVNAVIDLDSPYEEWRSLGDGYRVEARIIVWGEDDVLSVPASAVFRSGDGWAVYYAADGVASLRRVQAGRRNGVLVQIEQGLAEGDRVIAHPSDRVVDGVAIAAR
ncbi:MAG: efflux RND transporter periplasmic adaptor subunit [Sandaracinaceae bacterium]|nr:efflux RND transporter periplasmic adaptor subunit [Sandaracinaceae bacterium]